MKSKCFMFYLVLNLTLYSQQLDSAKMGQNFIKGESINISKFGIECTFIGNLDSNHLLKINDKTNWKVLSKDHRSLKIYNIEEYEDVESQKSFTLYGEWSCTDADTVAYMGDNQSEVQSVFVRKSDVNCGDWGFGEGKAANINLKRIADQEAVYAFDYNAKVKIAEYYVLKYYKKSGFGLYSFSADISSKGTFGKNETVQNGTQTSANIVISPVWFVKGLVYNYDLSVGYQIETKMSSAENKLFKVTNQSGKLSSWIEIPYTNYFFHNLHKKNKYLRKAMPITINVDYLFKGKNDTDGITPARVDLKLIYEMAFSPFLILKGEWGTSKFYDETVKNENPNYYSVTIAQDLVATNSILGIFSFLLGDAESLKDKYFMFFKFTQGKKPPVFQDINEKSFGLAMFF